MPCTIGDRKRIAADVKSACLVPVAPAHPRDVAPPLSVPGGGPAAIARRPLSRYRRPQAHP